MVIHMEDAPSSSRVQAVAGVVASRHADTRHPAAAVPEITGLRISPGEAATLVNISATGLLLDSPQRYAPGQRVTVHFEGRLATRQMKGRIVRCQVSVISAKGTLHYHAAIAFDERLALPNDRASNDWSSTPEADLSTSAAQPTSAYVTNRW